MNLSESLTSHPQTGRVADVLAKLTRWLESYGEASRDHQSFFAGPIGARVKALYYRHKLLGTAVMRTAICKQATTTITTIERSYGHTK